jgi:glycosyltransferase involved in cell wall biosynthesis
VEVVVACLREQVQGSRTLRAAFEKEGIRVSHLQGGERNSPRLVVALARLLKEEHPALLHSHLPRADLLGVLGRLLQPSVTSICSIHDIYQKSWSGRWTLPLFNFVWRQAGAVVAISFAVREWLVNERRVPADKTTVIHYGIEPERFLRPNVDLRKTWGLNGQAVVGSVGRLEPRKAHESLIQAMPDVLKQVPHACLFIAGHDPWQYGKNLQALTDRLNLNGQARLIGFQDDIPSFLHAVDVFAFASRSEGFGQVVIEAMAAGKPVVTSKIPPLTEIVIDGETGWLVEPENPRAFAHAIAWLLQHPAAAQQMGRRGQERVRRDFSAEQMAAQTLSLYRKLAGEEIKLCAVSAAG